MKMTNETLSASEQKHGKTRLFFTTLALSALAVSAVGGGAAFMIYHQFSSMPAGTVPAVQNDHAATVPMVRSVAVESPDQSDYRRVDNTVLPPAEARRVIAAWRSNPVVSNVPAPLAKTTDEVAQETGNRPPLTDPGSRYIISDRTGQVVGVDGTAGDAAEVRRAQPVTVQAISPEVRVASAVQVRAAMPVTPGEEDVVDPQNVGSTSAVQYAAVRRAQPVSASRPSFNAASYLATDDRPVLRGQTVVNPTSREAGYRQDFRLPDLSSR